MIIYHSVGRFSLILRISFARRPETAEVQKQYTCLLLLLDKRLIHIAITTKRHGNWPAGISWGADKSLAFPIFLFAAQPKDFFLDGFNEVRTAKS
jgi:hypothetical protein